MKNEKGRAPISLWRPPRTLLSNIYLLMLVPAFFLGCDNPNDFTAYDKTIINEDHCYKTEIDFSIDSYLSQTKAADWSLIQSLDVFVFNDDTLKGLDSYQRIDDIWDRSFEATSTAGDKIIVCFANLPKGYIDITQIGSYEDLENFRVRYTDETPDNPFMSGEGVFAAGMEDGCRVTLVPMLSLVELRSVRLSGEALRLKNIRAYMTNLSLTSELMRNDGFRPSEFLNYGSLKEKDLQKMKYPRMACVHKIDGGASFYCYPNDVSQESAGSPFTRLVIEGELDGETVYYPININRPGFGYSLGPEGINRSIRYSLNVQLTRRGTSDPEGEVVPEEAVEQGSAVLSPGDYISGRVGDTLRVRLETYPPETPVYFDLEDLEFDKDRGIYDYSLNEDRHGVDLFLKKGGSGMFIIDADYPVSERYLVVIVVKT